MALPQGRNHHKPSYAAMVEAMDQSVGKVLKKINALGLDDKTIIIFTSDNGPMGANSVAKPLRGTKGMLYEGGIRVPFFIRWPEMTRKGMVDETPIIGSDIYPTLLELIGHKSGGQLFDGKSFVDAMNGKLMEDRPIFWHFPAYLEMGKRDRARQNSHDGPNFRTTPCSVVRYGDWKLIRYYETDDIELFNLKEDIGESRNLADVEKEKKMELEQILEDWLNETKAPLPTEINPEYIGK